MVATMSIPQAVPSLSFPDPANPQAQEASREKKGSQPIKMLNETHADYLGKQEAWTDLAILSEGGVTIRHHCDRLLKQRPREDTDVFTARKNRFTYQNILGTALGWYGAAMFKDSPEILFRDRSNKDVAPGVAAPYAQFLDNCDGNKTTFNDFIRQEYACLLTFGSAWVLTDLKALEATAPAPQTLEDQRSRGLLDPHLVLYSPLSVINWQCDNTGALEWAVVKVTSVQRSFLGPKMMVDTWYYYDRQEYYVYRAERKESEVSAPETGVGAMAEYITSGTHALSSSNRTPIRKLTLSENLWLANRAYLLLIDHLNQDNTLAWSLFMSNLAIPVIIGDVDVTNMNASENGYYHFPAGTTYNWTEPNGTSFQHSAARLDSLREEAFRCMHLQSQGRSMHATPAMQSGRSKQLEMAPARDILAGMGDDVRRHMQEILSDVIDARQDKVTVADVRGFQFEDDMTTEEVFAVTSLLGLRIPSKTFEKGIYKKIAKAWMPDANRSDLEKIYREIEAGPTVDERLKEDLENRVKLTKAGMEAALNKKLPGGPAQPPGRGGEGPSTSGR